MVQGVEAGAAPHRAVLDERYHLDRQLRTRAGVEFWRATDTILDRTVAIHLVAGLTKAAAAELTAAAGRAGQVPDARWVRVLDVGSRTEARRTTVWIVSEWVDGTSLADTVRREPLRPPAAATVVLACSQAVSAARRAGAAPGGLYPEEVLLTADGQTRLTGLELRRALAAAGQGAGPAPGDLDDTRALGGLLFAALTGRWPLPFGSSLPPPRRGDGLHPRQQRRGVPRDLDEITATALTGRYPDPDALGRALSGVPLANPTLEADDPDHPARDRIRRIAWWVIPPLLVAAAGLTAWEVGSNLGKVPGADRTTPTLARPHNDGNKRSGSTRVWSAPPTVSSFDPDGDRTEDPGGTGLAVDADPSTAWSTDTYHGSPRFGGLKPGVGLLIDLGRPKRVSAARLQVLQAGADVELRAGDTRPQQATDLPIVGRVSDLPSTDRIALTDSTTARYWLLWITSLPKTGSDDYSLGVAEVALLH